MRPGILIQHGHQVLGTYACCRTSHFLGGALSVALSGCLGASILLHSVPPLSLNLSYLSEPVSGQGSHGRSAQSHHRCNITAPAVHNGTQYGLPSHGVGAGKQWQRAMRKAPLHLHNCSGQSPCLPLHHLNHCRPYHQGS